MDIGAIRYIGTEEDGEDFLESLGDIIADCVGKPITPALIESCKQQMTALLQDEVGNGNIEGDKYVVDVVKDPDDNHAFVYSIRPSVIDEEYFEKAMGRPPENDDLHRANCADAGKPGHRLCGWCTLCNKPRFVCGHLAERKL